MVKKKDTLYDFNLLKFIKTSFVVLALAAHILKRLLLWCDTCSIPEESPCAFEKNVHFAAVGWNVL